MVDDKPRDTRSIRLEITVPCDERFRTVLSSLFERMARYVGYSETRASELASSVVHATDGVLEHEEAPEYTSLGVTVATSETEIEFRVHYKRGGADGAHPVVGIERWLGRQRGSDAPIDVIRRVIERVEFGQDDGVEFCALAMTLPEEV
jgi:hypothetical protein